MKKPVKKPRRKPKVRNAGNSLNQFPPEVVHQRDLIKVYLFNNKIKRVPREIEHLGRIETLDLSGNRITQLHAKIPALQKLGILSLNNNRLKTLPRQIGQLKQLKILHLANNEIRKLPDKLGDLTDLTELNISYNKFTEFPAVIFKLKKLRTLWMGGNFFRDFPLKELFRELTELRRVYTYSNISYKNLTHVNSTYIRFNTQKGNQLYTLQDEIGFAPASNKRHPIFISYSHKDQTWLEKLRPHLKVLQKEGLEIDPWDDTKIESGAKWREVIENKLNAASAAILLISTNFLASDFITENELPPILQKADQRGLKIYCLIVSASRFTSHPELSAYETVNDPKEPLDSLQTHEVNQKLVDFSSELSNYFKSY
ncbi:MAG: leucine-rich repeat protein [Bacteroidota bacterium]